MMGRDEYMLGSLWYMDGRGIQFGELIATKYSAVKEGYVLIKRVAGLAGILLPREQESGHQLR